MDLGSLLKKLVNFLASRQTHLEDGLTIIKLNIKEHQATTVFITSLYHILIQTKITFTQKIRLNKIIYIVEFLLINKQTILTDNPNFYKINIQVISLLQILAQDSIIKEKDFSDSWNILIKALSIKSLYTVKTDCVDSDLNLSNGNSYKTIQHSWFMNKLIKLPKKNSLRIFLQFYKYLLVDGMEKENIIQVRSRKIKITKLLTVQKQKLQEWNNSHRYSYNKSISLINLNYEEQSSDFNWLKEKYKDVDIKKAGYEFYSAYELRDLIVPKLVCSRTPWLLNTPKEIRASACFEARKNLDVCLKNMKNTHINHFDLRFKSKKNNSWTIGIAKTAIKQINSKELGIYVKTMPYTFKLTERVKEIKHDCLLHFDGIDYYICIPEEKQMKKNTSDKWFVASDPGSRKFQTLFCPDENEYLKIGEKATYQIYKYLLTLDNLLSNFSKKPSNQLKLRILKLRRKINNYQRELHNKVSNYLCENYKTIYIPKLTKNNDIINCKTRKINTKTVRQIAVLGHSKFIETLKTKADLYTNVQVHIITEEYTSQTCLKCQKRTKSTSEIFNCIYCDYKLDRDLVGSTNILLKNW